MELRPQDVVAVLKLLASGPRQWTYATFAEEMAMSASHVFASLTRAQASHLLDATASYRFALGMPSAADWKPRRRSAQFPKPNRSNLKEFLIHGVKYAFPVQRGGPTRGIPTAEGASPLKEHFAESFPLPPVWPFPEGTVSELEFSPLYPNVPKAALRDADLYKLLVLVDAIREGRAREREIAIQELTRRIDSVTDYVQANPL